MWTTVVKSSSITTKEGESCVVETALLPWQLRRGLLPDGSQGFSGEGTQLKYITRARIEGPSGPYTVTMERYPSKKEAFPGHDKACKFLKNFVRLS